MTTTRELRDRHRWQIEAAALLVRLEEAAFHGDLPVLDWSVSAHRLVGRPPYGTETAAARHAVHAWQTHLDATWQDSYTPTPGIRCIQAVAERVHDTPVTVRIMADLDQDA